MKRLSGSMLALLLAAVPLIASPAGSDKTLQNLKGSVTYGQSATPTTPLALHGQAVLSDADYAATGPNSQATITLPDSSKLLMGSTSSIQMVKFDTSSGTPSAKFAVIGKVRFQIEHPAGAKADYTFTTSTGQIAVRGTVGDIFQSPTGGLQVNVYAVSNPALPVQVTLVNGQVFTLAAGQSMVATAVGGAITASVGGVTQASMSTFTELGPASSGAAGVGGTAAAATAATTATTTAAAVAAGTATAVTVASSQTKATPSPSPIPTLSPTPTPTATPTIAPTATPTATPTSAPSTTSVPITISGKPGNAPGPVGPSNSGAPHPGPIGPNGPGPRPGGRPSPRP